MTIYYENSPSTFTFVLTQEETAHIESLICLNDKLYNDPYYRAVIDKMHKQMNEQQALFNKGVDKD